MQAEWLADDDEDAHFRHRVYTPEQPAALLAALPFIQPLHTPETTLHFGAFTMSPELPAAVAATAEPGWGGVTLGLRDWGMDEGIPYTGHVPHLDTLALEHRVNDELLAEMLAIPFTSVDVFSPFALDLKTPLPLGTQVPWRRVEATSHFGFQDWLRSSHALRHTQSVWQAPDVNFWVKSDIVSYGSACQHRAYNQAIQQSPYVRVFVRLYACLQSSHTYTLRTCCSTMPLPACCR